MEIVKLVMGVIAFVCIALCIVFNVIKKNRGMTFFLEVIGLIMLIILAIFPLTNGVGTGWKNACLYASNMFVLVSLCAFLICRVFYRRS